jgi:hypothetical protein
MTGGECRDPRTLEPPAFSMGPAATVVGCSRRYLDLAAARGELHCVNLPGRRGRFVLPEDLRAFLRPRPADPR